MKSPQPNSNFAKLYKDVDENKSPPMCGQAALAKVLRSSPLRKVNSSSKRQPLYNESASSDDLEIGTKNKHSSFLSIRSPETGSSSSSDDGSNSPKNGENATAQVAAQFDITDTGVGVTRMDYGNSGSKDDCEDGKHFPPLDEGALWPSFRSTLSAVLEEDVFSDYSESSGIPANKSSISQQQVQRALSNCISQDSASNYADILYKLKDLVIKQRQDMIDMAVENKSLRKIVSECKREVADLRQEHVKQKTAVEHYKQRKDEIKAELKEVKKELRGYKIKEYNHQAKAFSSSSSKSPSPEVRYSELFENNLYSEQAVASEKANDDNDKSISFEDFKKALLPQPAVASATVFDLAQPTETDMLQQYVNGESSLVVDESTQSIVETSTEAEMLQANEYKSMYSQPVAESIQDMDDETRDDVEEGEDNHDENVDDNTLKSFVSTIRSARDILNASRNNIQTGLGDLACTHPSTDVPNGDIEFRSVNPTVKDGANNAVFARELSQLTHNSGASNSTVNSLTEELSLYKSRLESIQNRRRATKSSFDNHSMSSAGYSSHSHAESWTTRSEPNSPVFRIDDNLILTKRRNKYSKMLKRVKFAQ